MVVVSSYGAVPVVRVADASQEESRSFVTVKMVGAVMAGLMAAALVVAVVTNSQETPMEYKSELESYNKLFPGRTTMLEMADGVDKDQDDSGGYECCWKAPNPALASTKVASRVGPNGWGSKPDADGYVKHYENALGEVPEWVFKGTADHAWKSYDDVYNQDWFKNTYPSGESGI